MINLKIDPEFQSQIPPLTDDEFKQLEENILKEGKLISPLIVWNNTLVDGHNRYAILQKHPEIYFSTMPLRFENREEAIAWILQGQCNLLLHERASTNIQPYTRCRLNSLTRTLVSLNAANILVSVPLLTFLSQSWYNANVQEGVYVL